MSTLPSSAQKPPSARSVGSRLPTTFPKLAAELLDALIAEALGHDVLAIRNARRAELTRAEDLAWGRTFDALDRLVTSLRAREGAIARGEIERPEPPAAEALAEREAQVSLYNEPPREIDTDPSLAATQPDLGEAQSAEIQTAPPEPTPSAAAAEPHRAFEDEQEFTPEPDDRLAPAAEGSHELSLPELDILMEADEPRPPPFRPPAADPEFHERRTVILTTLSDEELAAITGTPMATATGSMRVEALPEAQETPKPPAVPAAVQANSDVVRDDAPRQEGWTRRAELLFEDALRLFRLGDSDGGLISLERLLMSTDLNDDLVEFVEVNQERILDLYEAVLAPWAKVPERFDDLGPAGLGPLLKFPKIALIIGLVNGRDTVETIAQAAARSGLRRLEVVAGLSQLVRAKLLKFR